MRRCNKKHLKHHTVSTGLLFLHSINESGVEKQILLGAQREEVRACNANSKDNIPLMYVRVFQPQQEDGLHQ